MIGQIVCTLPLIYPSVEVQGSLAIFFCSIPSFLECGFIAYNQTSRSKRTPHIKRWETFGLMGDLGVTGTRFPWAMLGNRNSSFFGLPQGSVRAKRQKSRRMTEINWFWPDFLGPYPVINLPTRSKTWVFLLHIFHNNLPSSIRI